MKTRKIIFWIFWGIIYIALALYFWKFAPGGQDLKENMAKTSFGITLLCLLISSMLDDTPIFWPTIFFSVIGIVLPFWPVPLGIIWVILVIMNKGVTLVTNYQELEAVQ